MPFAGRRLADDEAIRGSDQLPDLHGAGDCDDVHAVPDVQAQLHEMHLGLHGRCWVWTVRASRAIAVVAGVQGKFSSRNSKRYAL